MATKNEGEREREDLIKAVRKTRVLPIAATGLVRSNGEAQVIAGERGQAIAVSDAGAEDL